MTETQMEMDGPAAGETDAGHDETENQRELRLANQDYHEAVGRLERAKEMVKLRRAELAEAEDVRDRLIDRQTGVGPGATPLFDEPAEAAGAAEADAPVGWREVTLAELGDPPVPPGVLKVLIEHEPPIVTLGDLTDWQGEKGEFWVKDVKGLGPAKVEALAAATDAFWERNPWIADDADPDGPDGGEFDDGEAA